MGPAILVGTIVVAGFLLVTVAKLAGARHDLLLVRSDLTTARNYLTAGDGEAATSTLERAERRVQAAGASTTAFTVRLLNVVPLLGSPGRALSAATRAAQQGVAAGRIVADASTSFPTSASAGVEGQDLRPFHAAATRSQEAVREADQRLAVAAADLAGPAGAVLPPVSKPARAMRAELAEGRQQLAGALRGLALLADLTAPDTDIRLLVLAQDTLELRPTGGFIGSYGLLHFFHGTAKLEKYEATEDLPFPDPPMPPPPTLALYLTQPWTLSNSNWSPDFPTSAATATELFRRQGGGEVDGVLGLTELATARLVGVLGPLKLPSYPQPVVEEGFDRRIVYEVELKKPQDVPRKKYLVELSNVLFERLFHLPAEKVPGVADAVRRSIGAGDFQLWFKEPARQEILAGTQVAGALPVVDGDFLMVVDANMTASKANLEITKRMDYTVSSDDDGRLVGRLRIELRNEGEESPINPFYNAYLRVYVPRGARLLNPSVETRQLPPDGPYEVFSHPLVVLAKQQGAASFSYVLPDSVGEGGEYDLTWLRQVGTPRDELHLVVNGRGVQGDAAERVLSYARRL